MKLPSETRLPDETLLWLCDNRKLAIIDPLTSHVSRLTSDLQIAAAMASANTPRRQVASSAGCTWTKRRHEPTCAPALAV